MCKDNLFGFCKDTVFYGLRVRFYMGFLSTRGEDILLEFCKDTLFAGLGVRIFSRDAVRTLSSLDLG